MANLFRQIPADLPAELVETLCQSEQVRFERIVSRGHASTDGFWYDQKWHEFVLLVSGRARLTYADGTPAVDLVAGDWLVIPAHVRHRVDWTDPDQDSIWLAVHYRQHHGFELWRQDDHGQRFLVSRFTCLDEAEQRLAELTRVPHKQTYWIVETGADRDVAKCP